jgi:hypothetical protein
VWLLVFALLTRLLLPWELCFINIDNNELAGGTIIIWRIIVPYWKDAVGLGSIVCHTKFKKKDENSDRVVNDKPFINQRKPSSTMAVKGVLNNGEHTLIPVKATMIHSAVWDCKRFVLKDGRPLHMVKLVGAVSNFCVNIKHVQIDVEDGTGLVRVILWTKPNECMAQCHLIDKCNCNFYICVIGEVKDYYGVHEIIAFDVWLVSSGNEVTHHFFEVAYSFEKRLEYAEDEMLRAVPLKWCTCKSLN